MEGQTVTIENRERITLGEILDIGTFNETIVNLSSEKGGIIVKGGELKVQRLDLADGKVIIAGRIDSVTYTDKDKTNKKEKNFIGKIFK